MFKMILDSLSANQRAREAAMAQEETVKKFAAESSLIPNTDDGTKIEAYVSKSGALFRTKKEARINDAETELLKVFDHGRAWPHFHPHNAVLLAIEFRKEVIAALSAIDEPSE